MHMNEDLNLQKLFKITFKAWTTKHELHATVIMWLWDTCFLIKAFCSN